MAARVAFLTNAREYAGPPTAAALTNAGWTLFCHDDAFASPDARSAYERDHPGQIAAEQQDAAAFVSDGLTRFGKVDALISNDIPKRTAPPFSQLADLLQDFEQHLDSVLLEPVRLLRAALPAMRAARSGSIVLITSGAPLTNPSMGGPPHGYIAARAGAHGLVKALSVELAPLGIQVNAVAPFLVYSQTFFPSELGADDPQFAPFVNQMVPMQRFGAPEEIGTLIALLASGSVSFVSGQVVAFSGAGC